MKRRAVFSHDRIYRYSLIHEWDDGPRVCFVMLNPSIADATRDDHTITCCRRYAKDWGYGSLEVVNLFAYIATDPDELRFVEDPVGPHNDNYIWRAYLRSLDTVAAWGEHPAIGNRDRRVMRLLDHDLHFLKLTKGGALRHPSRLSSALVPQLWTM